MDILLVILILLFIIGGGGSSGDDVDERCVNCTHYSRFFGKCNHSCEDVEEDDSCWAFEPK